MADEGVFACLFLLCALSGCLHTNRKRQRFHWFVKYEHITCMYSVFTIVFWCVYVRCLELTT